MNYIQGVSREQLTLFPTSLDSAIDATNEVRQIDMFVNSLDMSSMGFAHAKLSSEGRPAYNPGDLLKLFIYGYLNRTRSSRELEKETKRNIEVMWLLKGLQPDHNTISNFRRDNPEAIRKVFEQTVRIAQHHDLIGGRILAGDSVKLRAQNSKKNNYNADKVKRHVEYIDKKLEEYTNQLAQADNDSERTTVQEQIAKHQTRKEHYERITQQLEESGQAQVSTSDPDSRQMIVRNNITEVAYNIQTINDAKQNIILDYKTTQNNDTHALSDMVRRAVDIVGHTDFVALYDKGYHTGIELAACHSMGVETLVAIPNRPVSSQAPNPAYNFEAFTYNPQNDTYTCPAGATLRTNGTTYTSKTSSFKQYKTPECKRCKFQKECTTSKKNGRIVQRSEHIENVERNKAMVESNPELYKKRQTIVEHPYGTIKRQWGFDHTLIKRSIERVSADVGLIFTCYNLRRLLTILYSNGKRGFFEVKTHKIRAQKSQYKLFSFFNEYSQAKIKHATQCIQISIQVWLFQKNTVCLSF
ncbi:MAG TPA: IS1182 family transposase [Bacteroidales bacterium]|nr:IS1182 family transposase [Bacteroidales bacterium]